MTKLMHDKIPTFWLVKRSRAGKSHRELDGSMITIKFKNGGQYEHFHFYNMMDSTMWKIFGFAAICGKIFSGENINQLLIRRYTWLGMII